MKRCVTCDRLIVNVQLADEEPERCSECAEPDDQGPPTIYGDDPTEFSPENTRGGARARERWARRYDDLNGAPEGPWDL